jgi:hypothetical protein
MYLRMESHACTGTCRSPQRLGSQCVHWLQGKVDCIQFQPLLGCTKLPTVLLSQHALPHQSACVLLTLIHCLYHALQNNLSELHALFDLCCEGLLGDRKYFKRWVGERARGLWQGVSSTPSVIGDEGFCCRRPTSCLTCKDVDVAGCIKASDMVACIHDCLQGV